MIINLGTRAASMAEIERADGLRARYMFNIQHSGILPSNTVVVRLVEFGDKAYKAGIFSYAGDCYQTAVDHYSTPKRKIERMRIIQP